MMKANVNKASICSVVALDIIDYAKKTDAEKLDARHLFDAFIQNAVLDISETDRHIMSTGSGVAIVCKALLEDALEDALFIAITIRDAILKHNQQHHVPLYVQFGIHLGAARLNNGQAVGEGIDKAQAILRFANPNQILISNVYFEMASKLTQEIAQMFEKYEMHTHDHDVYAVRLLKDGMLEMPATVTDLTVEAPAIVGKHVVSNKFNWNYIGLGLLSLVAFFMLIKLVMNPVEPTITLVQPEKTPTVTDVSNDEPVTPVAEEPIVETPATEPEAVASKPEKEKIKNTKPAQKTVLQKSAADSSTTKSEKTAQEKIAPPASSKPSEPKTEQENTNSGVKDKSKEKSSWQILKDDVTSGAERQCTQAEIALNQCVK